MKYFGILFCLLFLCGCTSEPSSQPAVKEEVFGLSSGQIEDGLIRAENIEKAAEDLKEAEIRLRLHHVHFGQDYIYDGKPFAEHGVIIEG